MIKENFVLTKITASEGYVLTNGNVYTDCIYLGAADSTENWKEVLLTEAPDNTGTNTDEIPTAVNEDK